MVANYLRSTELVSMDSTTIGPDLPYEVGIHCMVKMNEETVFIIGGSHFYYVSNMTCSYTKICSFLYFGELARQRKFCTSLNMQGRKVHPRCSKTNSFVTICIRKLTLVPLLDK